VINVPTSNQCDGLAVSLGSIVEDPSEGDHSDFASTQPTPQLVKANTAKWILKVKETQKLMQTCVDDMLAARTELCTVSISELGGAVDTVLQSAGLQMDDIPGLCELFECSSPYCRPFNGLDTYHHQL